jgi:hypothetical protein
MRAGLSTPDRGVIHARQVVEHKRRPVGKLDAAGRSKTSLRSRRERFPGGNGNESAPPVSAAKHRVAGSAGDVSVWSLGKKLG